ncbi:MAG: hypothetical protein EAZ31_08850 [Cytophagia bacterium]|nr:MAG: hypothetical protein EAZ31_08850 [Cytophagia bacterium]
MHISKRKLPHIYPKGAVFFVTFRLFGSLPAHVLSEWQQNKEQALEKIKIKELDNTEKDSLLYNEEKRFFASYDKLLDKYSSTKDYLKNPIVANTVAQKIREFDNVLYDLEAYCIMSNHVHLLIDTQLYAELPKYSFSKVMQYIKGGSAFLCNKELNRKGYFWEDESYDHFVRNEEEKSNIVQYILNNPIKAQLVKEIEDYPFLYSKNHSTNGL